MTRFRISAHKFVIALLVLCMLAQPIGAAAAPSPIHGLDKLKALATPGLGYLDSFTQTLQNAADLIPRLSDLTSGSPTQPTVGELTIARGDLASLGMESAEAIGRIEMMLEELSGISDLNGQAVDVLQVAQGIPQELQDDLVEHIGFTADDIAQIDLAFQIEMQERFEIQQQGLSAETRAFLLDAGYSNADIQSIEAAVTSHGITQGGLSTRADQLLASRDDLASLRSGAHILYVQLIGTEVSTRQRAGDPARSLVEEELQELAKDELRLLIHAAHIQSMLDNSQNNDVEGEFWFIERYAGRAVERLEALLLDTQNFGLALELFLLLELQSIAAEARFGGKDFAGDELGIYAGLLAEITGTNSFFARQNVPELFARITSIPIVRNHFKWPLSDADVDQAAKLAKIRFEANPYQVLLDDFPENNSLEVLLVAGYSDHEVITQLWHLFVLPLSAQALDLLALLLGFRDARNTEEMMALIVVSLIPILDILNDLITYATHPSTFVKVIALVGIFLSLGEITTLLFPGAIALGPATIVADSMATGVRAVYTGYGDTAAKAILDRLDDPEAIQWVTDLMRSGGRRLVADSVDLADEGAPAVVRALLDTKLFDDYLSYARVANNLDLLGEGVDEGAIFIGRISRQDEFIEGLLDLDFHRQLKEWGHELFEQGIDISDDAAGGIARAIKEVGPEGVERLRRGLQNASGEFLEEEVEFALDIVRRAGFEWSDDALEGVGRSSRLIGTGSTNRIFDIGEDSREAFAVVALRGEDIWDADSGEGLARVFEKQLGDHFLQGTRLSDYYLEMFRQYDDVVSEDVLRVLSKGDPGSSSHMLNRISDPRDLFHWRYRGNNLDVLEQSNVYIERRVMTQAEYNVIRQRIFDNWNNGQPINDDPSLLAEAFALEAGKDYLEDSGRYSDVVIRPRPQGTIQHGADGFAQTTAESGSIPIGLEAKGTYSGAELEYSSFGQPSYGTQTSPSWWLTDRLRHYDDVAEGDTELLDDLLEAIQKENPYEMVYLRGGLNPIGGVNHLDIGGKLDELIKKVTPLWADESSFKIRFVFINLLGQ